MPVLIHGQKKHFAEEIASRFYRGKTDDHPSIEAN